MTEELRKEVEILLKRRENDRLRLEELAILVYKQEEGCEFEGLPVEMHGYKKVLRRLGYVI